MTPNSLTAFLTDTGEFRRHVFMQREATLIMIEQLKIEATRLGELLNTLDDHAAARQDGSVVIENGQSQQPTNNP